MAELQQAWRTHAGQALQSPVDQGEPAKAPVVGAQPTTPLKKRHTGSILASAGGLVLLAVVGFGLWQPGTPPTPPMVTAPQPKPAQTEPAPAVPIMALPAPVVTLAPVAPAVSDTATAPASAEEALALAVPPAPPPRRHQTPPRHPLQPRRR
jgi:hypothetical protein